jgi:hypothetical protein
LSTRSSATGLPLLDQAAHHGHGVQRVGFEWLLAPAQLRLQQRGAGRAGLLRVALERHGQLLLAEGLDGGFLRVRLRREALGLGDRRHLRLGGGALFLHPLLDLLLVGVAAGGERGGGDEGEQQLAGHFLAPPFWPGLAPWPCAAPPLRRYRGSGTVLAVASSTRESLPCGNIEVVQGDDAGQVGDVGGEGADVVVAALHLHRDGQLRVVLP